MRRKVINLTGITVVFLLLVYLVRVLNRIAFLISDGMEQTVLYIMIQWIIPVIVFLLMKREEISFRDIGFSRDSLLLQALIGYLLGMLLAFFIYVIPDLITGKPIFRSEIDFHISDALYYIGGVAASEEILFRGYLFQKIRKIKDSILLSAIVSSALFGIFHIYGGNVYQILSASFFGMAFCLFRQKIKGCTLLSLIFAHGVYGTLGVQIFTLI